MRWLWLGVELVFLEVYENFEVMWQNPKNLDKIQQNIEFQPYKSSHHTTHHHLSDSIKNKIYSIL